MKITMKTSFIDEKVLNFLESITYKSKYYIKYDIYIILYITPSIVQLKTKS